MSNQKRLIWFKDCILCSSEARISPLSPTCMYGLNVFEGIRGYWNTELKKLFVFRLHDHIDRLFDSCRVLDLNISFSRESIVSSIVSTINANSYQEDIAIRVVVFVDTESSWMTSDPADLMIAPIAKPRNNINSNSFLNAYISSWTRISDNSLPPRVKAGANYVSGRYANLSLPMRKDSVPILLDRNGNVSETPGACIMLVKDNVILTPPNTSSILDSITRDTILSICEELGLKSCIRNIQRTDLYLADEIFICGSAVEITPILHIDHLTVKKPNFPITLQLLSFLHKVFDFMEMRDRHWCTTV